KTGYVRQSGKCLVASATRDAAGHPWRLICIVLKSPNIYRDSAALLNYGFAHFQPVFVASKGEQIGSANVKWGKPGAVPALAAAGVASRRDAEEMIASGRVQVDGRRITALGTKVDPDQAAILVDGRPITPRPPALYVALHKPAGFDTTRADPHAPHTVMELVLPALEAKFGRGHPSVEGLHPVGRLDRDSEGLLLLTNDGAFTQALTHPRHGVTKTYLAEVSGQPAAAALERLRGGMEIEGRTTRPARVRSLP